MRLRREMFSGRLSGGSLGFRFGLGKSDGALAFFPVTTLFHELNALEALHDRALTGCATFTFEGIVLGHRIRTWVEGAEARKEW